MLPLNANNNFVTTWDQESYPIEKSVVFEVGDMSSHYLWREWDDEHKNSFAWKESLVGRITYYGEMSSTDNFLTVKCDFLKVNNCVLLLFQPQGRFVSWFELIAQVKDWLGTREYRITNTMNFHNNHFLENLNNSPMIENEDQFPFGAQSAVEIEDEFELERFIKIQKKKLEKSGYECKRLPSVYKTYKVDPTVEKRNMAARIHTHIINDKAVTFLYNSGVFGDRQLLAEKAKEWFPGANFFPLEMLPEFF